MIKNTQTSSETLRFNPPMTEEQKEELYYYEQTKVYDYKGENNNQII